MDTLAYLSVSLVRKQTLSFFILLALSVNVLMLFSSEMMVEKEYACLFVLGKLSQLSLIFLSRADMYESGQSFLSSK